MIVCSFCFSFWFLFLQKPFFMNGEATSFWYDKWSSIGCLWELLGVRGFIDLGISATTTMAEAMRNHRRRRHRQVILNKVEDEIEKLKNENHQTEDIALWKSKAGTYKSAFSSRNTWIEIRKEYMTQGWSKVVWFKHATPKYSFHMWTAMRNRLSTCDRIRKWSPSINHICVLCQQHEETRSHLFFSCSYSSRIWQSLVRGLLRYRYTEDWEEIVAHWRTIWTVLSCSCWDTLFKHLLILFGGKETDADMEKRSYRIRFWSKPLTKMSGTDYLPLRG